MLRDISQLLDAELKDNLSGLVTFTAVRLTDDLRTAKVYYSYLGDEKMRDKVAAYLDSVKKRVRGEVGRHMKVRHIPELVFAFDPSIERGIRIEQLLNEINKEPKQ